MRRTAPYSAKLAELTEIGETNVAANEDFSSLPRPEMESYELAIVL